MLKKIICYLYNLKVAVKNFGFPGFLPVMITLAVIYCRAFVDRSKGEKKIVIDGLKVNFFNYDSLRGLYEEIFIKKEYYFTADSSRPAIIDCGSNIGMSVLYFKKLYPEAVITAFEPDPETFGLLRKNIEENRLSGVTAVNKAVAASAGSAVLYYYPESPGSTHMSLVKKRLQGGKTVKIEKDRLSRYIKGIVDLLKIDVEGSEAEIIEELSSAGCMKRVKRIACEIHHNITGKEDMACKLLGILSDQGFVYEISAAVKGRFEDPGFQDLMIYAKKKVRGERQERNRA